MSPKKQIIIGVIAALIMSIPISLGVYFTLDQPEPVKEPNYKQLQYEEIRKIRIAIENL